MILIVAGDVNKIKLTPAESGTILRVEVQKMSVPCTNNDNGKKVIVLDKLNRNWLPREVSVLKGTIAGVQESSSMPWRIVLVAQYSRSNIEKLLGHRDFNWAEVDFESRWKESLSV